MTDAALQAAREQLPEYVGSVTTKSRSGFWICPLCGSGTGANKSGAFRVQGDRWRCFSCGRGGDVLDLIGAVEGLPEFKDRARRAEELFGIDDGKVRARVAAPVCREATPKPEPVFIPDEVMRASFTAYERNNFALWLCRVFGEAKALELALAYRIGTSKHWPGAAVFWQIDETGRVRRGKVMLYDSETGRRVKEPGNMVAGVHWLLGVADRKPEPCLFGLHLAASSSKPVAVVESEKSAIIGDGFVPGFIWTATGGAAALNRAMLEPLQGRRVVLFPDLGAAGERWAEKAAGWPGVEISPLLEDRASAEDRAAGLDVADYLLRENFESTKS